ncbi:isoprenylcysteine carboxylmethyltransferase family protein [uncultured Desulfosarcina sp.]|uniref:methyltransferase family protein n=1 Tax=uncultured Desulfosarcina sp. TaxID=218289 RepID=UPI0029C9351D|nr:isoprenylcysteine carboxylmethyltransferase family protein [uncultured Desulfosarcina sp.]
MPNNETNTCKLAAVDDAQARHGAGAQLISRKPGALALVSGAYVLGGGGMLAWLVFLILGPLFTVPMDLTIPGRLLVDMFLCLLFFVQHSFMVRRRFRVWLTRTVRADFHGALYASVSGFCLLLLIALWQPVGAPLWIPPSPVRWFAAAMFLVAGIVGWWGSRSLGEFDALGVKPALRAMENGAPAGNVPFTVRGPYRWVRHPLYLVSLVIIWAGPVFTLDRLLHNVLWTLWIVIGATMEERDLVNCFGEAYRNYRKTVPMLLPRSVRPLVAETGAKPHNQT